MQQHFAQAFTKSSDSSTLRHNVYMYLYNYHDALTLDNIYFMYFLVTNTEHKMILLSIINKYVTKISYFTSKIVQLYILIIAVIY